MPLVASAATELIQCKRKCIYFMVHFWMLYMSPLHAVKQQQLHLHEAEQDETFIAILRNVTFSRQINYI